MRKLLFSIALIAFATMASAQTVHDYTSIEFSPGIRKLGVFSTAFPNKVVDLKVLHMDKRDLDINTFFSEVQDLESKGWEVTSQDIVALDKGLHMYVWTLRKARQ